MKILYSILYLLYKIYACILLVVTAILFFPTLAITSKKEKYFHHTHKLFVWWSRIYMFLIGWRLHVKQSQTLPDGPYIIVANHASYADIFVTPALFHKLPHIFLGKSEILTYPLVKHYFRKYHVPVFRDNKLKAAKSLIHARKKLEQGWTLIIFPEGGIPDNVRPTMIPFKDGAFRFACKNNRPIIPCFITMEDSKEHIDGDGYPVQEYTIHIMKPIYKDETLPFKEAVQKMKNQNFEMCKEVYERVYNTKLTYDDGV